MNEVAQVASTSVSLGQVLLFVFIFVAAGGVGIWIGRMASNRPDSFKKKIETPMDRAALSAAEELGWLPDQVKEALTAWAKRDLTSKVGAAYDGLPPDIREAAQKVADYQRSKQ